MLPLPPREGEGWGEGGLDLAELQTGPEGPRYGIYVHCVFCLRRCPYCDFNIAIYREDRVAPFVAALGEELRRYAALSWASRVPAVSLFLGGGTPSLLPPDAIGDLIAAARRGLGLVPDAEVTLEANPEGLDAARLAAFRAAGVTRLSLGVQSLDDGLLRRFGREHSAATARRAYAAARGAGFHNVSVDLLYAGPGQDLAAWTATLDEVLAWGPEHLSAYALTLEPGTPFGRRPPADLPDEEVAIAQFERLCERAAATGLERYEVSNFARSGFRSRHNLLYWRREEYLGLGPGAHAALGCARFGNVRAHTRYRAALAAGRWPIAWQERLTPRQVRAERIMLGLRLREGVPRAWLEVQFADAPARLARILDRYLAAGVLEARDGRLALTSRGVLLADSVAADLT
ncbi:MAG: radical SAM family heme chaperone HemW [Candidatus Rokubacteria bacterium]|nr:radical SAM family heme chaperone HemW [Candidatus Rokubacteria bacterium]